MRKHLILVKDMSGERSNSFEEILQKTTKFVDPGYGQKHVEDRSIAVTEFIKDVVKKVEERTPQLRVSEILAVGGFNEGTKIKAADEFDFLVVLGELSKPGAVTIERDDNTRPGNVKLKLTPGTDAGGKWRMFCVDGGYLRCFEEVRQTSIEDSFGLQVLKVLPKLEQNRNRRGLGTNHNVTFYGRPEEIVYSRKRFAEHIAMIKEANVYYPNVLLTFFFNGEEVTTDLCPAIRYNNVTDLFNPEFCVDEKLAQEVIRKGSVLLVGKGNLQFRVTFTETELDYMRNKISKGHKDLYIFLKVVVSFFGKGRKCPSSYALKITCIKHDLICKNSDGNKKQLQCLDEIIEDIIHWNAEGNLPSLFDRRLNIIIDSFDIRAPMYREKIVVPIFKEVKKLCHNMKTDSTEIFLEQVRTIVESLDKRWDQLHGIVRGPD